MTAKLEDKNERAGRSAQGGMLGCAFIPLSRVVGAVFWAARRRRSPYGVAAMSGIPQAGGDSIVYYRRFPRRVPWQFNTPPKADASA